MKKNDIKKLLIELSEKRPVFHSEADFQHELAWMLHKKFPQSNIRLERPYLKENSKTDYIDIFASVGDKKYFLELKYKTIKLKPEQEIIKTRKIEEKFCLKNQGARDCGCYDFWKDVSKIESKIVKDNNSLGYAIFLTNDHRYLRGFRKNTFSYDYNIKDGRTIKIGSLGLLHGFNKGREEEIILKNSYNLEWQDYGNYGFKFLLLEIK